MQKSKKFCSLFINKRNAQTILSLLQRMNFHNSSALAAQVAKYSPVLYFHNNESYFPCTIEHMLSNSTLKSSADPTLNVVNPTQQDLMDHPSSDVYLEVDPSQFSGMKSNLPPMYCAVQQAPDNNIVISYIILYAFQGGQTLHVDSTSFTHFLDAGDIDVIVNDYGMHVGDLERVQVVLNAADYTLLSVGYEAHGDMTAYPPEQVLFEQGSRPVVNVALNGHSAHNSHAVGLRVKDQDAKIFDVISVMDDASSGVAGQQAVWRPTEFLQLGLDAQGRPINDQVWAAYRGKLGKDQINTLHSASFFDGSGLGGLQWAYLKSLGSVLDLVTVFHPLDFVEGTASAGPGGRDWVSNALPIA